MASSSTSAWRGAEAATSTEAIIGSRKEEGVVDDDVLELTPRDDSDVHDVVNTEAQAGVQKIEAVTLVWSKTALWVAYVLMWVGFFIAGLLLAAQSALLPYVTSAFSEHSLTPTVNVVSTILGGCTNFTVAKILDVFGRPQGYLITIVILTIGLIMDAACRTVESYAAAQVFYTVGNVSFQYILGVFVADTTTLRNRGLIQAFLFSPYMITAWVGGPLASGFLDGPGWRWGYGMLSILVPVATLPLWALLQYNYRKARKQNVMPTPETGRSRWQSMIHVLREFDAVGLLLISAGVALFLLPFNIYYLQADEWRSPLIICLLVFGIVLFLLFIAWERFFAPIKLMPYSLISNRTVFGACLLNAVLYFAGSCWASFYTSFLQVVNNLSVTHASYVYQTYNTCVTLSCLVGGAVIRYTGKYKPLCLYIGVPLSILGTGLMMYFRQPNQSVGYLVMCEIFMSFAGGIVIITDEIAALSAGSHQDIAIILAAIGFFGNIGGAIGYTITAAIWQNVFPTKLAEYLPASELPNLESIYASLETQLSYAVGSPARTAIQRAYGEAQRDILIAGTAVWAFGFLGTLMWRNTDVTHIKQVKGHVF